MPEIGVDEHITHQLPWQKLVGSEIVKGPLLLKLYPSTRHKRHKQINYYVYDEQILGHRWQIEKSVFETHN